MNNFYHENKRSLVMLSTLLFILAIILFFLLLRPLMTDLSIKEKAIQAKEDDIQLLEAQIESMEKQLSEEDPEQLVLEKKIPTERKLDEYILSLEKLESKTNSQIDHITFTYDSQIETIDIKEDEDEAQEAAEEAGIDHEILKEKPDELQVITVRFVATSPSFNEFIKLLQTIEQEERISIVSQLEFQQPTAYEDDEEAVVSFEVYLTTFYYSGE